MKRILLLVALLTWSLAAPAQTPVERGRYLVETIAACGNCHTPQTPDGPDHALDLAGGNPIVQPGFSAVPPNITPDEETGIGRWSDEEVARAIREGVRPDGRVLGPPMPFELYRHISDVDVAAIVAYLRTVSPVRRETERSTYEFELPPSWGPPLENVPEPDRDDPVAWGAYLAGPLGHCTECHSRPGPNGVPDLDSGLGAGGFPIHGPWGVSVSANITPTGLAGRSDDELKQIIPTGVRADGTRLRPPMGFAYYAGIRDEDLDAIVAYLRSLPPK